MQAGAEVEQSVSEYAPSQRFLARAVCLELKASKMGLNGLSIYGFRVVFSRDNNTGFPCLFATIVKLAKTCR